VKSGTIIFSNYPGLPPPPLHPGIAAPGRHTLAHSCGSPVGWLGQCGFPCSPGSCGLSAKTIEGEVTTPIPNNIAKQHAMKKFSLYIPNFMILYYKSVTWYYIYTNLTYLINYFYYLLRIEVLNLGDNYIDI
jgi:hypothetical protein